VYYCLLTCLSALGHTDAHVRTFFEGKSAEQTKALLQASSKMADPLDSEVRPRLDLSQGEFDYSISFHPPSPLLILTPLPILTPSPIPILYFTSL
jgi:hypothetical protein